MASTDVAQLVTLNPNDHITFSNGQNESVVTITNSSLSKKFAFESKTNKFNSFITRPNKGVINANSSVQIEVIH